MARETTPEPRRAISVDPVVYLHWTDWGVQEVMGVR